MSLAGKIGEIAIADVIQMCGHIKCTGTLIVVGSPDPSGDEGAERGRFYFEAGELCDATLDEHTGLDAVYAGLDLRDGAFRVEPGARTGERRIFLSIGGILLEGMRRLDEERRAETSPEIQLDTSPTVQVDPPPELQVGTSPEIQLGTSEIELETSPTIHLTEADELPLPPPPPRPLPPPPPPPASRSLPRLPRLPPTLFPPSLRALTRRRATVGWRRWAVGGAIAIALVLAVVVATIGERLISARLVRSRAAHAGVTAPDHGARETAQRARAAPGAAGAVQGVTPDEIRFGIAAPFTGLSRELGRQMKLGIDLAFAAANEGGGIYGRKLRLISGDDGYEPTRTLAVMKQLADGQRVFGVIGNVGTPTAAVALPFALERRMLFFGAFSGASLLRRNPPDRYVFNFRASFSEEMAAAVSYLVKTRRVRPEQIAVFAEQGAFGDAGYAGVARAIRGALRADPRPILRLGYRRNTVDVDDAVARLHEHSSAVRAVVLVAGHHAAAKFIQKVRDLAPYIIFASVSFVDGRELAEELTGLGPEYANGVIVTQVVPPVDCHATGVLKYHAALARYFPGEKPDAISLEGFWSAGVLIEGLRRAGPALNTERLVDALEQIQALDLGLGATITLDATEHQASHKVWATELDETGRFRPVDLD